MGVSVMDFARAEFAATPTLESVMPVETYPRVVGSSDRHGSQSMWEASATPEKLSMDRSLSGVAKNNDMAQLDAAPCANATTPRVGVHCDVANSVGLGNEFTETADECAALCCAKTACSCWTWTTWEVCCCCCCVVVMMLLHCFCCWWWCCPCVYVLSGVCVCVCNSTCPRRFFSSHVGGLVLLFF